MYPSLASAKAAVISVGEEIATIGLPSGICPLVFVFTGNGNGISLPCQFLLKFFSSNNTRCIQVLKISCKYLVYNRMAVF